MKYHNLVDKLKKVPPAYIKDNDVILHIDRNDLVLLLSELLNNCEESPDEICRLPLKLTSPTQLVKKDKASDCVFFSVDAKTWSKL